MQYNLDIHAPATQQPHCYEAAKSPQSRKRLAKNGYITYLRNPDLHTNGFASHAGWGQTPEQSYVDACYWANQVPWVVTVPWSRAPQWAREEALANE